jgi:hypothetical protein
MSQVVDPTAAVVDHFRRWLQSAMTGCAFATHLSGKRARFAIHAFASEEPADWFDGALESHGDADRVVALVFPWIADEEVLVRYLMSVQAQSSRWKLHKRKKKDDSSRFHLGITWRTKGGLECDLMGFAPFATMPVPRRAPYVALAAWPGGRKNPFNEPKHLDRVSFLDVSHGLHKPDYDKRWTKTLADVDALMRVPSDRSLRYTNVAFTLPLEVSSLLD